jgi:hypothetical protein
MFLVMNKFVAHVFVRVLRSILLALLAVVPFSCKDERNVVAASELPDLPPLKFLLLIARKLYASANHVATKCRLLDISRMSAMNVLPVTAVHVISKLVPFGEHQTV